MRRTRDFASLWDMSSPRTIWTRLVKQCETRTPYWIPAACSMTRFLRSVCCSLCAAVFPGHRTWMGTLCESRVQRADDSRSYWYIAGVETTAYDQRNRTTLSLSPRKHSESDLQWTWTLGVSSIDEPYAARSWTTEILITMRHRTRACQILRPCFSSASDRFSIYKHWSHSLLAVQVLASSTDPFLMRLRPPHSSP